MRNFSLTAFTRLCNFSKSLNIPSITPFLFNANSQTWEKLRYFPSITSQKLFDILQFPIMRINSRSSRNVRNRRKLNMRIKSRRNRYGSFLAYSLNYALSIPVLFHCSCFIYVCVPLVTGCTFDVLSRWTASLDTILSAR